MTHLSDSKDFYIVAKDMLQINTFASNFLFKESFHQNILHNCFENFL